MFGKLCKVWRSSWTGYFIFSALVILYALDGNYHAAFTAAICLLLVRGIQWRDETIAELTKNATELNDMFKA